LKTLDQVDLTMARQEIDKLEKNKKQLEVLLKAEQEQNKKLQAQVRELDQKIADQEKVLLIVYESYESYES